jgi:prephenate dehydrogenase
MRWHSISLIGAGLLGGSLALALKRRQVVAKVLVRVRRESTLVECNKLNIADVVTQDLKEAVQGSELVILCTPLSQMAALTAEMAPFLKLGAIVTDVGSVKGTVVRELEPLVRQAGAAFVGSHPMAGSEKTGVAAARADLSGHSGAPFAPGGRRQRGGVLEGGRRPSAPFDARGA